MASLLDVLRGGGGGGNLEEARLEGLLPGAPG